MIGYRRMMLLRIKFWKENMNKIQIVAMTTVGRKTFVHFYKMQYDSKEETNWSSCRATVLSNNIKKSLAWNTNFCTCLNRDRVLYHIDGEKKRSKKRAFQVYAKTELSVLLKLKLIAMNIEFEKCAQMRSLKTTSSKSLKLFSLYHFFSSSFSILWVWDFFL